MRAEVLRRGPQAGLAAACAWVICAGVHTPASAQAAPAVVSPLAAPSPGTVRGGRCAAPPGVAADLEWPARGAVTSPFGRRGPSRHEGIDISGQYGRGVRAAAAGEVIFSGTKRGYGRVVMLRHAGGLVSVYAHNQDNFARVGTRVERGQLIADMGSSGHASGPHVHFELRVGRRPIDPLGCLPPRAPSAEAPAPCPRTSKSSAIRARRDP